jgi:hypothetical protein
VVLVRMVRASVSSPLYPLLLVGLRSFRRAAIVTDASSTERDRAFLESWNRAEIPPHTFLTFDASFTEPISCFRLDLATGRPGQRDLPPLGLSGAPPPMYSRASTLPEPKPEFGPQFASHGSRSAPVGFHHFDGLLRSVSSGRVASRYRTWGSLGFRGARRHHPKIDRTRSSSPPAPHPSKVCSSSVAVPHRWGLLPPDRSYPKRRKPPPDRRTRVDEWGTPPACRGATEHVRRVTAGHFLPSGTARGHHLRGTRGAGLFASSRETLPEDAGLPPAAGHQHSNLVTSTLRSTGTQDLLASLIGLRSRDLPVLPAQGRSRALGSATPLSRRRRRPGSKLLGSPSW